MEQELSNIEIAPTIPEMNFTHVEVEELMNTKVLDIMDVLTAKGYLPYFEGTKISSDETVIIQFGKPSWHLVDSIGIMFKDNQPLEFCFNQTGDCWLSMMAQLILAGYEPRYLVAPTEEAYNSVEELTLTTPFPTFEVYFYNIDKIYSCSLKVPRNFDEENYNYIVTFSKRFIVPVNGVDVSDRYKLLFP